MLLSPTRKIYQGKIDIFVIFNSLSQKSESDEVNQVSQKEEKGDRFNLVFTDLSSVDTCVSVCVCVCVCLKCDL